MIMVFISKKTCIKKLESVFILSNKSVSASSDVSTRMGVDLKYIKLRNIN